MPEVLENTDLASMITISALVFIGMGGVKLQCRAATNEELQREETESRIKESTGSSCRARWLLTLKRISFQHVLQCWQ
jgi:hypothetical protein